MKEEEAGREYFIWWHLLGHITLVMKIKIWMYAAMQRLQKYHKDNLLFQFIQIINIPRYNEKFKMVLCIYYLCRM